MDDDPQLLTFFIAGFLLAVVIFALILGFTERHYKQKLHDAKPCECRKGY